MLVNRDQDVAHTIKIAFHNKDDGRTLGFSGDVHAVVFGKQQYAWHPQAVSPMSHPENPNEPVIVGGYGHADPDGPPKQEELHTTPGSGFEVPAASIMVIRGSLAPVE
jgi:hypothetical protein